MRESTKTLPKFTMRPYLNPALCSGKRLEFCRFLVSRRKNVCVKNFAFQQLSRHMESIRDIFSRTNNTDINYIEYSIYFPPSTSEKATCQALCDYEKQIESLIEPFLDGHFWQKDKFKLRIVRNDRKGTSLLHCYCAHTLL